MKARCDNPKNPAYARYGGRGITIDPSWRVFENFYQDMGEPPFGFSLERLNNAQGYSKTNCVWATASEQNRNKRIPVNNKTGLKGVHWCASKHRWIVKIPAGNRNQTAALQTRDFFEACCVRKSWENRTKEICK